MKRIISLLLIVAMTFVLIISVSASESSVNQTWKTYDCYNYGWKGDIDPLKRDTPAELYTRMAIWSDLSMVRIQSSIVWRHDPKIAGKNVAIVARFIESYQRKEHWTDGDYERKETIFFDFPECPANFSDTMIYNKDYPIEIPYDPFGFYFWKGFRFEVDFYYDVRVGTNLSNADCYESSIVVVPSDEFPN